jgi:hypothetical protein
VYLSPEDRLNIQDEVNKERSKRLHLRNIISTGSTPEIKEAFRKYSIPDK